MLPEGLIRIKFSKTGKIKYISHLDLCRTLKTAFIRSNIPIKYTEGFNPHPKMVFALTVSVGSESLCEYLDIKLTRPMEEREFIAALQGAVTRDLKIHKVYVSKSKFTDLAFSRYRVDTENPVEVCQIEQVLAEPMVVPKHSKKGDIEVDVRPMVKSLEIAEDGSLDMVLNASQGNTLNPEYVLRAIEKKYPGSVGFYRITRTECYFNDMTKFY